MKTEKKTLFSIHFSKFDQFLLSNGIFIAREMQGLLNDNTFINYEKKNIEFDRMKELRTS